MASFQNTDSRDAQAEVVVLRDGSTVRVRPSAAVDTPRLLAFLRGLTPSSRVFRFLSATADAFLEAEARREAATTVGRAFGLLALTGAADRVVGHALCAPIGEGDRADIAFAIAEDFQGRGLGTILLGQLADLAARRGVETLEASVSPENHRMLDVFRDSGFPVALRARPGEVHVEFPASLTEEALRRFEQREQIAAANAVRRFLSPRTVAVIGASRDRTSVGGAVFHNLLRDGFAGPVYPVNRAARVVQSVPAYPEIGHVPESAELAVVTVPAVHVPAVAQQCADAGVRALVVISAGFGEIGDEGRAREADLLAVCRTTGMRLIGPNCLGVLNTHPAVRLNATFAPAMPPAGRIGFFSQSGALGLAIIDYASSLGLGISSFVSIGNRADISSNDLLSYWESDPETDVILLYVESFGNPRRFGRIARRVGRTKPIVVVKSGRSPAGARAASSHTGALVAASDVTVDALFRQAGVIRTDTLEELFDVAALLGHQPLPAGSRVAILTNVGGPAILCADAAHEEGLGVPALGAAPQARLRAFLPPEAGVGNPVDMLAAASADHYRRAIGVLAEDPDVDALIVIFIPVMTTDATEVARAIVAGARELAGRKPILAVFMSARGMPGELRTGDCQVPSYAFPEAAARALARVVAYAEWRRRPVEHPVELGDIRRTEAAALVAGALARGGGWLEPDEVAGLLACYGIPLVEQRVVRTPQEAAGAAAELGGRVALKGVAPGLVHKTEAGGVRIGLAPDEARRAAEEMDRRLRDHGTPASAFLVQKMALPGVEMLVGVVHDRHFGPLVALSAGGTLVELLRDVAVRLAPLRPDDAALMVRELRTYPLLTGFRGAPPADVPALEDIVLRIGLLADELPQVAELDMNPVLVHPHGATVVDARVRVAPAEGRTSPGAR